MDKPKTQKDVEWEQFCIDYEKEYGHAPRKIGAYLPAFAKWRKEKKHGKNDQSR